MPSTPKHLLEVLDFITRDSIPAAAQAEGLQSVHVARVRRTFAHVFRSAHEKFIVIDGEVCIVQSGNYSAASIPMNVLDGQVDGHFRTGNCDMGVAVTSKEMAKFLTKILDNDIKLDLNTPEAVAAAEVSLKAASVPIRGCAGETA